ncbi:hypothetical protein EDC01DRAFT_668185 [Geopyxis carbonaria]|nr:hypothetical protein EDC01DRAFT_668185 [Geopyxis carbonaria]
MDNHWAVTTSSGRRVSLLCEDKMDYSMSYAASTSTASPTPPPSPDYHRPYAPIRADSISSACSSTSSLSTVSSQGLYSPKTPPNMNLPPLEKLLPVPEATFFPSTKYGSETDSPVLAPTLAGSSDGSMSPSSSHGAELSTPPSPKTAAANLTIKRSSRRYSCQCGKSFTTSGHLARHTRIHTGEKNYVCPETGCGARFSRQDNCMQHFRTHQNGAGSKRATRKRRMSTDSATTQSEASSSSSSSGPSPVSSSSTVADSNNLFAQHRYAARPALPQNYPYGHYAGQQPYGSDSGLAALASVACSGYT